MVDWFQDGLGADLYPDLKLSSLYTAQHLQMAAAAAASVGVGVGVGGGGGGGPASYMSPSDHHLAHSLLHDYHHHAHHAHHAHHHHAHPS